MLKISLVAFVGLCVVMTCGCIGASEPTRIEISTNNLGAYAENGRDSIVGIYIALFDSNGKSVAESGDLSWTISRASVKKSGEVIIKNAINSSSIRIEKRDFLQTQSQDIETDSGGYVRIDTKDIYLALFGKVIHSVSAFGDKYNDFRINNYIPTREMGLGFSNKTIKYESDCIIDTSFKVSENPDGIGTRSCSNLMVQVDFRPNGSDSTIHAEKLLTA